MKFSELLQIIKYFGSLAGTGAFASNEAYAAAAGNLAETMARLATPDGDGNLPKFDNEALLSVLVNIGALRESFKQSQPADAVKENFEKSMSSMEALVSELDVKRGVSLEECIAETEPVSIRIEGKPESVGGAVSKRELISIQSGGRTVEGFYTREEKYMEVPVEERDIFYDVANEVNDDDQAAAFVKRVENSKFGLYSMNLCVTDPTLKLDGLDAEGVCRSGYDPRRFELYGLLDGVEGADPDEKFEKLLENHSIARILANSRLKMRGLQDQISDHQLLGKHEDGLEVVPGSSKSGRNIAMSRIANLLGAGDRLAKSRSVTLQYSDGTKTNGVFMETAVGQNLPDIKDMVGSAFENINKDSFNGEVLKGISEVQFIDNLCMNTDRHARNLLYTIDDKNNVTNVMGIDHDTSFGTVKVGSSETKKFMSALDDINVVSVSMKKAVLALSPETIKAALTGTGLKDEEIAATQDRLMELKERLVNSRTMRKGDKIVKGQILTVPDELWKDLTFNELLPEDKTAGGPFAYVNTGLNEIVKGIENHKYSGKKADSEEAKLNFSAAVNVDELSPENLNAGIAALKEFNDELKETQGLFSGSRQQFKDLRKAMDELEKTKFTPGTELSEAEMISLYGKMQTALNAADAYIDYKSKDFANIEEGSTGRARLDIVRKLRPVLATQFESFGNAYREKAEANLDEASKEIQAENARFEKFENGLAEILMSREGLEKEAALKRIEESGALKRMLEADDSLQVYSDLLASDPKKVYADFKICAQAEEAFSKLEGPSRIKFQIAKNIFQGIYEGEKARNTADSYQQDLKKLFEDPGNKLRSIAKILNSEEFTRLTDRKTEDQLRKMEFEPKEAYAKYLNFVNAKKNPENSAKIDTRSLLLSDMKDCFARETSLRDLSFLPDSEAVLKQVNACPNPLNIRITRNSFSSVLISQMLQDGFKLDDIMEKDKLVDEKKAYIDKSLDLLKNGEGKKIVAGFRTAMEKLVPYVNRKLTDLCVNGVSLPELMKDKNRNLIAASTLACDIKQECERKTLVNDKKTMLMERFEDKKTCQKIVTLMDAADTLSWPVTGIKNSVEAVTHLAEGTADLNKIAFKPYEMLAVDAQFKQMKKDYMVESTGILYVLKQPGKTAPMQNIGMDLMSLPSEGYDTLLANPGLQKSLAYSFMDGSANKNVKVEYEEGKINTEALSEKVKAFVKKAVPEKKAQASV